MHISTRRSHSLAQLAAAVLLALCSVTLSSAAPQPPKIQVTAAIPSEAVQGTAGLGIQIKGQNFAPGASVRFLVSGSTSEGGINVIDVAFVDGETLQATVDVDAGAAIGNFDIEVQVRGSGKGKGTELFRVTSSSGASATTDSLRLTFRDAPGDRFTSDDAGAFDPALLCADPASSMAQFWSANAGLLDASCQGSADYARMHAELSTGRGLLFRTHGKDDIPLPGTLPPGNRWVRIDFSVENDGTIGANCPDIDTVWYSDPTAEIASMYPDIEPGCVDNVEVQFRAGNDIFTLPAGTVIGTPGDWDSGPHTQIRIPEVFQKNKRQRLFQLYPEYSLVWDTMVVTVGGDGNSVTIGCGDELGHDCVARLTEGDIVLGPGATNPVLIGYYDIPLEVTVQRVVCDDSGNCGLP